MSAFGGKADMTFCKSPLSWSLLGVKRTWVGALHMSAFDPKRTFVEPLLALAAGDHRLHQVFPMLKAGDEHTEHVKHY